jgi:hypothetical protein
MCGARRSGYLFMLAGGMFLLAASLGREAPLYGLAAAFVALGASRVRRARRH